MLHKAPRNVRVAVLNVVKVIVSSSDWRPLPHHSDGVGSGTRFKNLKVLSSGRWSFKIGNKKGRVVGMEATIVETSRDVGFGVLIPQNIGIIIIYAMSTALVLGLTLDYRHLYGIMKITNYCHLRLSNPVQ